MNLKGKGMKVETLHTPTISTSLSSGLADPTDLPVEFQVFLPGFSELPEAALRKDTILIPDRIPVTPTRRLVVLVPPGEVDERTLVRRIWQLAANSSLSVLYLAIEPDDLYLASQRRRLSGMASLTSSPEVRARASVSPEKSWPRALESTLHPGDLLVCLAGHTIRGHFVRRRKLGEILVERVAVPVYLIGDLKIGLSPMQQQRIKSIQAWTASFTLIVAFFGLQVELNRSISGTMSTFLLCLSVLAELYILWKINQWIG